MGSERAGLNRFLGAIGGPAADREELSRAHVRELVGAASLGVVTLAALLLVYGLCWLFITYGNAEHAEKVVYAALGVLGGIGIGLRIGGKE